MGCGCNAKANNTNGFTPAIQVSSAANCMLDRDILLNWQSKLECVQQNNLYNASGIGLGIDTTTLNRLLGVVQSALNWSSNYCYFENQLGEVLGVITKIIASGQCGTSSVNN